MKDCIALDLWLDFPGSSCDLDGYPAELTVWEKSGESEGRERGNGDIIKARWGRDLWYRKRDRSFFFGRINNGG